MSAVFLFLRIVHVFGSVLWVGSAISYMFFVQPSVKSIGPAGGKFMQHFIGKARYPFFMNTVSMATILSGAFLYVFASGGMQTGWILSGPGIGFTIGSVVGILVWFVGFLMIRPRAERLGALGREISTQGGPPTPEQGVEMARIEAEMGKIDRVEFVMLSLALLTMGTARYWNF